MLKGIRVHTYTYIFVKILGYWAKSICHEWRHLGYCSTVIEGKLRTANVYYIIYSHSFVRSFWYTCMFYAVYLVIWYKIGWTQQAFFASFWKFWQFFPLFFRFCFVFKVLISALGKKTKIKRFKYLWMAAKTFLQH